MYGGEGGIRTPDSLATMSDFESGAFNRALPTLRCKPFGLNHLQCNDRTLNAVVSLETWHLEWPEDAVCHGK